MIWNTLESWDKVIVEQFDNHLARLCIVRNRGDGSLLHGLGNRRRNCLPQPFERTPRHCSNVGVAFLMLTP